MNPTRWGLAAGIAIGLIIAFGTFTQLVVVAFFTLVGGAIGWFLHHRLDLSELLGQRRR